MTAENGRWLDPVSVPWIVSAVDLAHVDDHWRTDPRGAARHDQVVGANL